MTTMTIVEEPRRDDTPMATLDEPTTERVDWPGRWLGGAAGAISSLLAAAVLYAIDPSADRDSAIVSMPLVAVPLIGVPIAFALGRAAFPSVRRGGWRWALAAGVLVGLAAPPLGALAILFGPFLVPLDPATDGSQLLLIAFLPIAIVFSYLVVFITVPVGLLTTVAIRALPADLPVRLRVHGIVERLGTRHALLAIVVWAIVIQAGTALVRAA